jgi:hypothetical protein
MQIKIRLEAEKGVRHGRTFKCKMLKIHLFPQKSYNYEYTGSEIIFHRNKKELFVTITGSGMKYSNVAGVEAVK